MSNKQQLLLVAVAFLTVAAIWFLKQDPTLNRLNATLQADAELSAYPYPFRVIAVEETTAVMSSPRSAQVSVLQFFKITRPELDMQNPDSPTYIKAQKQLAQVQEKAGKLIKAQPEINDIRWEIDRHWYAQRGLIID